MLPSSPSLRSIDRSFLLRAASPCRVPLFFVPAVANGDVVASNSGVRIASSACVQITQDACASNLSNGFTSDPHDPSREARGMWRAKRAGCGAKRAMRDPEA
jgi:hypothetical protein